MKCETVCSLAGCRKLKTFRVDRALISLIINKTNILLAATFQSVCLICARAIVQFAESFLGVKPHMYS